MVAAYIRSIVPRVVCPCGPRECVCILSMFCRARKPRHCGCARMNSSANIRSHTESACCVRSVCGYVRVPIMLNRLWPLCVLILCMWWVLNAEDNGRAFIATFRGCVCVWSWQSGRISVVLHMESSDARAHALSRSKTQPTIRQANLSPKALLWIVCSVLRV